MSPRFLFFLFRIFLDFFQLNGLVFLEIDLPGHDPLTQQDMPGALHLGK